MPTNSDRAAWAQAALDAFQSVCRTDDQDAIKDLVCDLLHLARQRGENTDSIFGGAELHFNAEVDEEAEDAA